MKKQLLSIILVLAVLIGIMPYTAFSEDIGPNSSQADVYGDFIDGQQVISDMIEKNGMFAHPRIIDRLLLLYRSMKLNRYNNPEHYILI